MEMEVGLSIWITAQFFKEFTSNSLHKPTPKKRQALADVFICSCGVTKERREYAHNGVHYLLAWKKPDLILNFTGLSETHIYF